MVRFTNIYVKGGKTKYSTGICAEGRGVGIWRVLLEVTVLTLRQPRIISPTDGPQSVAAAKCLRVLADGTSLCVKLAYARSHQLSLRG